MLPVVVVRQQNHAAQAAEGAYARRVIRIYKAGTAAEAHLLVDELHQHRIETYVNNEASQGMLADIASSQPDVCLLDEQDWERAMVVVRQFEAAQRRSNPGVLICAACKEESPANFELCWRCRNPLSDAD
ncbi:MAG TPA: DUF2007 domain-containing protein [Polyangiaceae bacterium]|nr:DUF2007 domain-containing protein [Polyangiaceae bacterium]